MALLAKFVKDAFYLADILQLHKYQVFVFINKRNIRKGQQSSGKLRLYKSLLFDKWPVECYCVMFGILINITFVKHFMKTIAILRCIFKVLSKLCCLARFYDLPKFCSKIKTLWIFFEISPKVCVRCLVVFVNWRKMVYLNFF